MDLFEYHKCAKEGCEKKTRKEFCAGHTRVLNKCTYPHCIKSCVDKFCFNHKPETMENKRKTALEFGLAKRMKNLNMIPIPATKEQLEAVRCR